jgi:hypothetical protein
MTQGDLMHLSYLVFWVMISLITFQGKGHGKVLIFFKEKWLDQSEEARVRNLREFVGLQNNYVCMCELGGVLNIFEHTPSFVVTPDLEASA